MTTEQRRKPYTPIVIAVTFLVIVAATTLLRGHAYDERTPKPRLRMTAQATNSRACAASKAKNPARESLAGF